MMLRNASHIVALTPPVGSTEPARNVYATVGTLTMEARKGTYVDFVKAAVSIRTDDVGPIRPNWSAIVTTPEALAGTYTVKLVAPSPGHVRIIAERTY